MATFLLSNNRVIDSPSEAQILEAILSLSNEDAYSFTMNRISGYYLKFTYSAGKGFEAEYQVDRPMIRFQSSAFHCEPERAATMMYHYLKGWSPKDFLELKWVGKTVIDKTFHSIKIFSRVMMCVAFMLLLLGILRPEIIQPNLRYYFLALSGSWILAESDSYYRRYYFDEPFYYKTLVGQILWVLMFMLTLLGLLWS